MKMVQSPASGSVSSHTVYLRNEAILKNFIFSITEKLSFSNKKNPLWK